MSMRDKLHTGELYLPMDDSIMKDQLKKIDRLYDFNATRPTDVGRILRTFKIKKNVEVTDNGKIII